MLCMLAKGADLTLLLLQTSGADKKDNGAKASGAEGKHSVRMLAASLDLAARQV